MPDIDNKRTNQQLKSTNEIRSITWILIHKERIKTLFIIDISNCI